MDDTVIGVTYAGLFLAAIYDRTGTPTPAVVGGIAAASSGFNLVAVIALAVAAGLIGELVYYLSGFFSAVGARYLGRRFKLPSLSSRVPRVLRQAVRPEVVGNRSVLVFGRFLPAVGRLVSPLAGLTKVAPRRVATYTFVGQSLLVSFYALMGYFMARALHVSSPTSIEGGTLIGAMWVLPVAVAVLANVFWLVFKRNRTTPTGDTSDGG
jgi:membrane protein DedA with SNARE-associated domain